MLITGSSKGIGKSIAEELFNAGYRVFLTGRDEASLIELSNKLDNCGFLAVDLLDNKAYLNLIEKAVEKLGNIDILVNNAGDYIFSPVEKTTDADIQRLIRLNFEIPYLLIKNVTAGMKAQKWGRIINIGSISGVIGEANASLYSATKSAFVGLSKSLGLELAQDNITVNSIHPGWVQTQLAQDACVDSDFSVEENLEIIPQKRFIDPCEIAHLVKYLVSEQAKGLTGQSINLCAGLSVG